MRGPLQFLAVAALCKLAGWEVAAVILAALCTIEASVLAVAAVVARRGLEGGLESEIATRVGVPPEPAPPPPPRPGAPADP